MHPASIAEAKKIFLRTKEQVLHARGVNVVICPPTAYLAELRKLYSGTKLSFGAQNCFGEIAGSFTGEVSAPMLKSIGASHVIIGHSERRALGEDNAAIKKKVSSALHAGLKVILCVGEHVRSKSGTHLTFIRDELAGALEGIELPKLAKLTIAYEPIWAIGKSAQDAMQPQDVHEMVLFIRKEIKRLDAKIGENIPVLYGGSVEPENCEALVSDGFVDGFLVGHASLVPKDFSYIVQRSSAVFKKRL